MVDLTPPPFDEQSARATLYAMALHHGELGGMTADADEVTQPDGAIGFAPALRLGGRVVETMRPIWGRPEDRETAKRFALDVARLAMVDRLIDGLPAADMADALRRFRRGPRDPSLNPVSRKQNPEDRSNEQ